MIRKNSLIKIVFYRGSQEFIDMVTPKIKDIFDISQIEKCKDGLLK